MAILFHKKTIHTPSQIPMKYIHTTALAFIITLVLTGCAHHHHVKVIKNVVHSENLKPAFLNSVKAGTVVPICSGQPVPQGWVVVSWGNSMSCPGWTPGGMNVMNIKQPGPTETICSGSPIPPGYVVVSWGNSMNCPGWTPGGMNTMNIKIPGAQETVCGGSPIPPGYVVIGSANSMSCPGWTPTSSNQKIIKKL